MIRSLFSSSVVVRVAAAVLFTVACQTADAQVKPFKVNGGGPAPLGLSIIGADSPHSATGNATHLGKYSGDQGIANVLSFDDQTLTGTFRGSFVFVAANGDELATTYGDTDNGAAEVGTFQVIPVDVVDGEVIVVVEFIAEFNPIIGDSTGRFEKVIDGSFLMIAMTEPFPLQLDENFFTPAFDYSWEGEGFLEFRKGN
jgi:hypothetical protein